MPADQSSILVSVLLPCYNARDTIELAIKSITEQTHTHLEIIVIDDGSTDDSYTILTRLSQEDSRIKLYRNESNLMISKTLNRGIRLSKGKYIARMDADDIALSHRIEKQVAFMESHPEIIACGSSMRPFGNKKIKIMRAVATFDWLMRLMFFFITCIYHPTAIIRRKLIEEHCIFYKEEYTHAEDYKFWIDCMKHGKLANIRKVLLLYRIHSDQVSQKYTREQTLTAKRVREEYRIDTLKNLRSKIFFKQR